MSSAPGSARSARGVVNTRVPTARQRNGDFSEFPVTILDPATGQPFPGNLIPAGRIDPIAKSLLTFFPEPNADPNVLGGNRNYSTSATTAVDFREELLRMDYRLSSAHLVYGRFIHDTLPSNQAFGEVFGTAQTSFPGLASLDSNQPGRGFVGAWNWVLSSNMFNEAAYQYSRGAILSTLNGTYERNVSIPKIYTGSPGDEILPGISFGAGGYGGWNFFGPYDNTYGSHRIKDTLTWIRGNHSIKTGLLFSWEFKNENAASGTNGAFNFPGSSTAGVFNSTGDAFADFLLGRSNSYSETNVDIASHLRYQMYELFAQDDWKVKPNLTLNLGLRWSWIRQPVDTDDVLTNFDPSAFDRSKAYQISSANVRVKGTGDQLNGMIIAGRIRRTAGASSRAPGRRSVRGPALPGTSPATAGWRCAAATGSTSTAPWSASPSRMRSSTRHSRSRQSSTRPAALARRSATPRPERRATTKCSSRT